MKLRELIFVLIIVGYLLAVFSFLVNEYNIKFQNYERKPMQIVELYGNGSTRSFEIEDTSPDPDLFSSIFMSMSKFAYALPFVIAGIGLAGGPMALISNSAIPSELYRVMVFWIMAIIAVAITSVFFKDIPLWRRIPYIYFIGVLISGTPILLSEDFGR